MKIYTRGGDAGTTGLYGRGRVGKGDLRVEALGAVDELNAVIGWVVAQLPAGETSRGLLAVQHDLFNVGVVLASRVEVEKSSEAAGHSVDEARTRDIEIWIDEISTRIPDLTAFILPGGTQQAAALHLARTVCRRAERALVRVAEVDPIPGTLLAYINRLSDLFFVLARLENHERGGGDVVWRQ